MNASSEVAGSGVLLRLPSASAEEAVRAAAAATGADGFAVGTELLAGPGPAVVGAVARVGRVLVAWPLAGEPDEVGRAAARLVGFGASWVTVQAASGVPAIEAAVDAAANTETVVLAATLEPHLDDAAVASLGMSRTRGKAIARLAAAARSGGAAGVVCAPTDLTVVADAAPDLQRFVVGIASAQQAADSTARGADYLVVDGDLLAELA